MEIELFTCLHEGMAFSTNAAEKNTEKQNQET